MPEIRKYTKLVIMAVICVDIVIIIILAKLLADSEAPVISFTSSPVTYIAGEDSSRLLEGVSAWDDKDGDVSGSVVIESITPIGAGASAKVVYAARDKNSNIAKASRIVNYAEPLQETYTDAAAAEQQETEAAQEDDAQTQQAADTQQAATKTAQTQQATTKTAQTQQATTKTAQTQQTATKTAQTQASTKVTQAQQTAESAPVMAFIENEAVISAGSAFNITKYIDNITDDKDAASDLFRRILINGSYDTTVPGDYTIQVYCRDSDGNTSAMTPFTLHVR